VVLVFLWLFLPESGDATLNFPYQSLQLYLFSCRLFRLLFVDSLTMLLQIIDEING
jgi:hypothetical protein